MPGFISHTVHAFDMYERLENKNINRKYFATYSLGGDLCTYAPCRYDSHHKDLDKFVLNMADCIRENGLENDEKAMAVLYGHICHVVMDGIIHPLVRKADHTCVKSDKNHTLIEVYYDSFLIEKVFHCGKRRYLNKMKILRTFQPKRIRRLIDESYLRTYGTPHVSRYYRLNMIINGAVALAFGLFGERIVNKAIKLDRFFETNRDVELLNESGKMEFSDCYGNKCSDSLSVLYDRSVETSFVYINAVLEYMKTGELPRKAKEETS